MAVPLLISNLTNIRYLTGLSLTAGVMLVKDAAASRSSQLLFVDDRYLEKAKKEVKRGIKVLYIEELQRTVKKYKRVRFEADDLTVTRLNRWKKRFRGTKLVPSEGVIEKMRRKKKPAEIRAIEEACRITDRILKALPKKFTIGKTEKEIAWEIEKMARAFGAEETAFETIVAFGPHTSRPHHRPTKRKLKKGNLVQIDMGVKVDGYCSDCSRVFFTKKRTEEQKKVFNLLLAIVKETTKMAKPGVLNTKLDKYARDTLTEEGWGDFFLHSLGHGIGLEVHEGINLTSKLVGGRRAMPLLANEVVTTEPGIYFAGKWGMRIEDTLVVERSGGKRLTNVRY